MTDNEILKSNDHKLIVVLDTIWMKIVAGTLLMILFLIFFGDQDWLHLVAITFIVVFDGVVKDRKEKLIREILKNDRPPNTNETI